MFNYLTLLLISMVNRCFLLMNKTSNLMLLFYAKLAFFQTLFLRRHDCEIGELLYKSIEPIKECEGTLSR